MEFDCPVTIRTATSHHVPDLIWLGTVSSTGAQWSELQYGRLFPKQEAPNPRLVLIADCNLPENLRDEMPSVVGFLIAHHIAGEWELENIVVMERARGKGIGRRLLETLLDHAKQTNSESVFLEVRESNVAARGLYSKLGFLEIGRRKSYYNNPLEDAILYARKLHS